MIDENTILKAENLSMHFGGNRAVDDVSFALQKSEVLAILGDNGAGKSTLIKMIAGVHTPTDGSIFWKGEKLGSQTPQSMRELGIETIYQDLALADNLGIASNIFLGKEIVKKRFGLVEVLDEKEMEKRSDEILDRLKINIPNRKSTVRDLSGGQRQSVAISRAVYWQAALFIMDEPTAALGVKERQNILDLIRMLKSQEISIILISHNLGFVFEVADRLLIMRRGKKISELAVAETSESEVVRLMIGSEKE